MGELQSLNELRKRKLRRIAMIATFVIVAVGLPSAWFGPGIYSNWRQRSLIRQARGSIAHNDYRGAAIRLSRVFGLNPDNIEASRLMADLANKVESPAAVGMHRRVSSLLPDSFDDAFGWAAASLKANDLDQACKALAILKRTGPDDTRYYDMAGRIAAAGNRHEEADSFFAEALRREPGNADYLVESAANEAEFRDPARREEGVKKLRELSQNPDARLAALRALQSDAFAWDEANNALEQGAKIAADPAATFPDRLKYLNTLWTVHHPRFSAYLAEMQGRARDNAEDSAILISWMNQHTLAMLAATWSGTLDPKMISKPPPAPELAESYLLLIDWKKLQAFVSRESWGDLDFIREAFLARALRETGDVPGSASHWSQALSLAARVPARLPILEQMCSTWDWRSEAEETLWLIADTSEKPLGPLHLLARRYFADRDTHQLNRVWEKIIALDPAHAAARNNRAMTSLLLGLDKDRDEKDAADLVAKDPSNSNFVATYTLALHYQNRSDKGIALMRALKPEDLARPHLAACYGVLLADKASPDAAKYLAIARKADLLPQEKQLVLEALNPALRAQAQPTPFKIVEHLPIEEPTPSKFVLHPMPEATPFKYVFHPEAEPTPFKYVLHPAAQPVIPASPAVSPRPSP